MKILHTSDWHLGVSPDQAPREQDHVLFLDWLIEQVDLHDVDVLVHSGDTFHYIQPSARALRLYYKFLARCAAQTRLSQVVVTGGNHDSPSRLDAPSAVLEALNVHVVGGLSGDPETWGRCLTPLVGRSGEVEAVVMAVPYIHESRLGVNSAGMQPLEVKRAINEKFRAMYATIADIAEAAYPDVPIIATGHLTCYPKGRDVVEGAYHTPIHLVEALGALPPDIFDLRYSYVALGHVHQKIEIPSVNAWYPGSPVPTDVTEARSARHVLLVEVDPDAPRAHAHVTEVEVPQWRPVLELSGPADEVFTTLEEMAFDETLLDPYLYLDLHVEAPMPDGVMRIDSILEGHDTSVRPRIVRLKETLVNPNAFGAPDASAFRSIPLDQLTPTDIFKRMYQLKHEAEPTQQILAAFHTLLSDEERDEETS